MIIVMCSNSDDNNDNNDNDDNNNRYIMHYCIPIQYIYIYMMTLGHTQYPPDFGLLIPPILR